jgi:FG-GAP-like repeat
MDNWRRLGAGWRSLGAAALLLPLVTASSAFGQSTGGNVYNVYPIGYKGTMTQPAFTGLLAAYFTCSNNGDGNKQCPARVVPGDTIMVHAGTYIDNPTDYSVSPGLGTPFDGTYYLTAKGTADKPISIVAAGDGPVIFDGGGIYSTPRNHNLFNVMAADYNVFQGITVRNTDIAFLSGVNGILGATGFTTKNIVSQNVRDILCSKTGCVPYGHNTHDFDGSGTSDILWRDSSGDVGMWLMNGSTIGSTSVLGQNNWSVVGQRDFDGDGNADILLRDNAGNVGIWLMNGSTVTSASVLGNVPTNWSVAATGDFNGDGKGDIVWRDDTGNVGIWFMNGATAQQMAVIGSVPVSWVVAGADINGDIFWRDTSTGNVGMWVMNGANVTKTVTLGSAPSTWKIAGIGDFDANGSDDIVWRDNSGTVGIWFLNGTTVQQTAVIGQAPQNWSLVQTGDYSGAGPSDLLWIDDQGNVVTWFMNGSTIASTTTYGNVGTNWMVQSLAAE